MPTNPIITNPIVLPVATAPTALTPANPTVTSTSPSATVTVPNTSGAVTLQLVVTDNLGVQSEPATVTVEIQGPPTAVVSATPNPVAAGKPIALSGAGSTAAGAGSIASYSFTLVSATATPIVTQPVALP
jgi:hypothetical protein